MAKDSDPIFQSVMQLDRDNVSWDPIAFDNIANEKGVLFKHFAALACPNATYDSGDTRSPHIGGCCENGYMYFYMGSFRGIMTAVNKNSTFYPGGSVDHSQAYVILPRFYEGTQQQMLFSPYDKLVPTCNGESLNVIYWEQNNINETGIDTLSYPIKIVEILVDGSGKRYFQNSDFEVKNGKIIWGQNRPSYSLYQKSGQSYSIRYQIEAVYQVNQIIHDVRMSRTADPISGQLSDVRYPMYLQIQKQINFFSKNVRAGNLSEHFAAESY